MKEFQNKNRGFTLIELLVVISIISILSSVILASLNEKREKALATRVVTDLRQFNIVLELYYDENDAYPSFDHNWNDAAEIAWSVPYINWPKNPWGWEYHWEFFPTLPPDSRFGFSIRNVGPEGAQIIDDIIDDGVRTTGDLTFDVGGTRINYWGRINQNVPPHASC